MAQRTYCATVMVTANNPHRIYNTTSKPSVTQVGYYITNVSAELDMRIQRMGVAVPISTSPVTYASLYLRKACAYEAAAMAEDAAYMGGNKQESTHGDLMHKKYLEVLVELEKNPLLFSDSMGKQLRSDMTDHSDEHRDREPFIREDEGLSW